MQVNELRQRLTRLRPADVLDADVLRRRWERLRFRSEADYLEFIIRRAVERGS